MKRFVDINEVSDGKLYTSNDLVKVECNNCIGCFNCCKNMGQSIVLDPYDIFRLGQGLKISFEELLTSNIELNVVDGIILPNLKMDNLKKCCNFLDDEGRCSIHKYRPGICRMFPLGRIYDKNSFKYFLQIYECSSKNKTKVKVKKWLDTPDIIKYEKYINDWHNLLLKLEGILQKADKDNLDISKKVSMTILNNFYIDKYDYNQDFYIQFYERVKMFENIF